MYKTPTIVEQLDRIGEDILRVLAEEKTPMTVFQLHVLRDKEKCDLSSYGWSFALDRLERKHLVEFVSPCHWQLKDQSRTMYIRELEDLLDKRITPD